MHQCNGASLPSASQANVVGIYNTLLTCTKPRGSDSFSCHTDLRYAVCSPATILKLTSTISQVSSFKTWSPLYLVAVGGASVSFLWTVSAPCKVWGNWEYNTLNWTVLWLDFPSAKQIIAGQLEDSKSRSRTILVINHTYPVSFTGWAFKWDTRLETHSAMEHKKNEN